MKKILIISISLIIAVFSLLGDAFSCGMMKRSMMRGMRHHDTMSNSVEETSHALSHDNAAMEQEVSGVEPARLVENRCSRCHSLRFIFRSRKADWSHTVHRMNSHMVSRNMLSLTNQEKGIITGYLNTHYSASY